MERWLPIVGWEGLYDVSDLGRVRNARTRLVLKPKAHRDGYRVVDIYRDGKHNFRVIHRLVLIAFSRLPRKGEQCRHLDGLKANNVLHNLRWGTSAENAADKIAHGHTYPGESNVNAKLTELDVAAIRLDPRTHREIAAGLSVHRTQITKVKNGKSWTHV